MSSISEIKKKVKKIEIKNLEVDESKVVDSANIVNDLGADSLDQVELVMEFEDKFGIEIPEETKKVNLIYKSFRENKSQPFLLRSDSISEAIREGTRQGKFGYCNEIKMVEDKFVADINKECFGWEGYIVNKDKIYQENIPDDVPVTSTTSTGSQQTFEDNSFRYQIDFDDFTAILDFVTRIGLLNLKDNWKSSQKQFNAKVNVGDTAISIESSLSDYMMLKGILNSISGKNPSGTGYLIITSEKDLQKEFKETEIDARVI